MIGNTNVFLADSLDEQTDGQNALLDLWVIKSGTHSVSLLICNHFSRKVVLQPEKRWVYSINQGPLITDGRNSNEMFILPTVGYPWHFKSNKGIITKSK